MSNPFSLKGKKILVTGASSGLGVSIAKEITNSGGNVIITGRNQERLNNTFNQLLGDDNISFIADLCNVDDIDEVVKNIPNIDGIVFCAGIIKTLPIKNINDDAIEEIFHTNIISSIQISNRLLKAKKLNKSSSIVFISSVSTFNVKIGNSLYSATKGAVNSFARAMALEVSKQDMRVNCIQPGFIPTGMLVPGTITQEQINEYIAKHPLGLGRPTDVSYACVYFLSDASRWVTGSVITIDGGLTLR